MTEVALSGGDLTAVVRIGETVRRPTGPWTPAVHSLLRHLEAAGFDGAPRALGIDDEREILSYVAGEPALAPVPAADDAVWHFGSLLRLMHDAQAGFARPAGAAWQRMAGAPADGEVICHNDLFWPNVIFRSGRPAALIDWDLAAPGPRLHDVGCAARFWVPLRPDSQAEAWGLPTARRRERLKALCDGYGLRPAERPALIEAAEERGRIAIATYRAWGRDERRPGWSDMWDRDADRFLVATQRWLRDHRQELASWLG